MSRGECKILKQKKLTRPRSTRGPQRRCWWLWLSSPGRPKRRRRGGGGGERGRREQQQLFGGDFDFGFLEEGSEERLSRGGCRVPLARATGAGAGARKRETKWEHEVDERKQTKPRSLEITKKTPFSFQASSCKVVVPSSAPPVATTDPRVSLLAPPAER